MYIIIIIVLLSIIIIFWILDSYYLKIEKNYRKFYYMLVEQYNNNKSSKQKIRLFDMNYEEYLVSKFITFKLMFSRSEIIFYLPIFIALAIYSLFVIFISI